MTIWHTLMFAACVMGAAIAAPAMSPDAFKAAAGCRALAADPSAANLERRPALRYRAAPMRVCARDDTNNTRPIAFA